jgi:hypothetical protein
MFSTIEEIDREIVGHQNFIQRQIGIIEFLTAMKAEMQKQSEVAAFKDAKSMPQPEPAGQAGKME